jgi:hypothetical protein
MVGLSLAAGIFLGAFYKPGTPTATHADQAVLASREAAVDAARVRALATPDNWEVAFAYALSLAQWHETRSTGQDHPATAEQEALLNRLADLSHSPEQEKRRSILERRTRIPTRQAPGEPQ